MKKSDFFYSLPQELIAQHPCQQRDNSSLMVLHRQSGEIEHKHFYDLPDYLNEGDCLIINDTKVLPARIYGVKIPTGAVVEFLLLKQQEDGAWECLAGPGKKAKPGDRFSFGDGLMECTVEDIVKEGNRLIRFEYEGNFYENLDKIGTMPLPPYITEQLEDQSRYQTIYAREMGSAAAPTAGLHFTDEVFKRLEEKGVKVGRVTLHVGLGTFRPVKEEEIENHVMHSEHYELPAETAELIQKTKENGGRVICVGTTSCRTVESVASKGEIKPDEGWTSIFIYPGYEFGCMDGLVTNFHLPESTLLMLISAFAGYENVMNAYEVAVKEKYRFFSFGDAMLIL
jgi:S-adenosylmethionine:tRNA ribosyltransferase-isomerase